MTDGTTKLNLKIEIRRNSDGVVAADTWEDWDWHQYWWEHGNAACDCNRELFFLSAQGLPNPEVGDECGCGRGAFSVRCTDADTGEVLYNEWEDQ